MTLTLMRTEACPAPTSGRLRLAFSALGAMLRALRNRRAALRIADLPDDLLNDIGLKRDDVHAALQSSWRTDPTYRLAVIASERRCRR